MEEERKLNILFLEFGSVGSELERKFQTSKLLGQTYIISHSKHAQYYGEYVGSTYTTKIGDLKKFLKEKNINLVICFAENHTIRGFVDFFKFHLKIPVLGCTKEWFKLESSKTDGKFFMAENGIKSPSYTISHSKEDTKKAINEFGLPIVIKNNNLKAGFGSYICRSEKEAFRATKNILKINELCIVEKFIKGEEISVQYLWDEENLVALNPVRDFKKSSSDTNAINTGGMGCYTPVCLKENQQTMLEAYNKQLEEVFKKNKPNFTGVFVANLLFTNDELYTLEFNMRPGITEFETIIENMDCDVLELLWNCAKNKVKNSKIKYKNKITGCVNLAHKDYLKQKSNIDKINIRPIIESNTNDIKLNFNYNEINNKHEITLNTYRRFLSILYSDGKSPFEEIYKYIDKVKNRNIYYRKDIKIEK